MKNNNQKLYKQLSLSMIHKRRLIQKKCEILDKHIAVDKRKLANPKIE